MTVKAEIQVLLSEAKNYRNLAARVDDAQAKTQLENLKK